LLVQKLLSLVSGSEVSGQEGVLAAKALFVIEVTKHSRQWEELRVLNKNNANASPEVSCTDPHLH
jgi:hypothetical protein